MNPLLRAFSARLPLLAFGVLLLAAATFAHARDADYPEWPTPQICIFGMPYISREVMPNETGFVTEVLKAVFEQKGIQFEHRNLPYPSIPAELKKGNIHCTLAFMDRDNPDQGKAVITIFDLAVAYRASDGFQGVEAMKGERVGSMQGFDLQSLLPVKVLPQTAYDITSILYLLDQGKVKYVVDEESLIRDALLETKLPTSEFGIHRLASLNVHPFFAPTEAGKRFQALYDRRMKEIASSGRLASIFRAHGLSEEKIEMIFKANGY